MLYVITSVYKSDEVEFVRVAVESLFAQTYSDFKIYMMCDGPIHSDVLNYLRSIEDERFSLFVREHNRGLATCLNEMLDMILNQEDAEYIARMDSDDLCLPHRFEKQVEFLKNNPDIDIVGSYITESLDPTKPGGRVIKYPINHREMMLLFGKRIPLAHPSVMFRKSFFQKAGKYPADGLRSEDAELWLKGFLNGCRFSNIPEVLLKMRVNRYFYKRRLGKEKSTNDYKLRKRIIKELKLPKRYYFIAYGRYLLFAYAHPKLLECAYKSLR